MQRIRQALCVLARVRPAGNAPCKTGSVVLAGIPRAWRDENEVRGFIERVLRAPVELVDSGSEVPAGMPQPLASSRGLTAGVPPRDVFSPDDQDESSFAQRSHRDGQKSLRGRHDWLDSDLGVDADSASTPSPASEESDPITTVRFASNRQCIVDFARPDLASAFFDRVRPYLQRVQAPDATEWGAEELGLVEARDLGGEMVSAAYQDRDVARRGMRVLPFVPVSPAATSVAAADDDDDESEAIRLVRAAATVMRRRGGTSTPHEADNAHWRGRREVADTGAAGAAVTAAVRKARVSDLDSLRLSNPLVAASAALFDLPDAVAPANHRPVSAPHEPHYAGSQLDIAADRWAARRETSAAFQRARVTRMFYGADSRVAALPGEDTAAAASSSEVAAAMEQMDLDRMLMCPDVLWDIQRKHLPRLRPAEPVLPPGAAGRAPTLAQREYERAMGVYNPPTAPESEANDAEEAHRAQLERGDGFRARTPYVGSRR
jgi:hypothetical protein